MTDPVINVLVKSPNQKLSDLVISTPASSTVFDLKRQLSVAHPDSPSPDLQRLIYCGRLMQDGSQLSSYFDLPTIDEPISTDINSREPFHVHLVVAAVNKIEPASTSETPQFATVSDNDQNVNTDVEITRRFQLQPNQLQQLKQEYQTYVMEHYRQSLNRIVNDAMPESSVLTSQLNSRTLSPGIAGSAPSAPPAPAPPPRVVEDPPVQRDIAEFYYNIFRLILITVFIYYYSSSEKALAAILLFSIIIVLQTNYLRDRLVVIFNRMRSFLPTNQRAGIHQQFEATSENRQISSDSPNSNPSETVELENQNSTNLMLRAWIGNVVMIFRSVIVFIATFFSSLVPERPLELDIN